MENYTEGVELQTESKITKCVKLHTECISTLGLCKNTHKLHKFVKLHRGCQITTQQSAIFSR